MVCGQNVGRNNTGRQKPQQGEKLRLRHASTTAAGSWVNQLLTHRIERGEAKVVHGAVVVGWQPQAEGGT